MKIEDHIQSSKQLSTEKKVLINLLYTGNWLNEVISEKLKDFDISTQQFNVLRILKGRKGKPANLSTIQERMIAKNSNTTRLVDKLIKKELVTRKKCPTNKRKVEILITNAGLQFLDQVNKVVENKEMEIVQHMSKNDLENLNELLNKLRD
ncbi:MAG: MarR family transcriptional regulator [Flavobacteriaceae bacterium]|nr:MarR family transcriptional regulator [Flavobacteriaceae bacterium]